MGTKYVIELGKKQYSLLVATLIADLSHLTGELKVEVEALVSDIMQQVAEQNEHNGSEDT